MTVARASWTIGCDDDHYEAATRDAAVDLWILAIDMLRSHERRRSRRSSSADAHFEGPTVTLPPTQQAGGPS